MTLYILSMFSYKLKNQIITWAETKESASNDETLNILERTSLRIFLKHHKYFFFIF